jgi:YegS/Rv2252/BmrU family lipid kinase
MIEVVVNPAGAAGRTLQVWKQAETYFKASGKPYRVHYSTIEHDIDAICKELTTEDRPVSLVIVGGDGSMNRAVNGIQNFARVKLGFLPCGSGNDLAKALHISKDLSVTVPLILEEKVQRHLDIGEVTYLNAVNPVHKGQNLSVPFTRRFNISSGIGFDAHICQQADVSRWKKKLNRFHLGKLIYIFIAVRLIFTTAKGKADLIHDGKQRKDRILFTVCMNTAYEGGGFQFCPQADPQDGKLDYCTGGDLSKLDFFRIFPYAYFGKHVKFHGVHPGRCDSLEVKTERPMWVHQDGEVECMSDHVKMNLSAAKLNLTD